MNNSNKSILARACDPVLSAYGAKMIPPKIGNPEYIYSNSDADFFDKLSSRKWSVIYFAPGACRFSAAGHNIPGQDQSTLGWTIEDYKKVIYEHQDSDIQIVEALDEGQSLELLKNALSQVA